MNIVRYNEYESDKVAFFKKHKNDYQCETQGSSAEYYRKTYVFADGAIWYEVMQQKYVETEVEIYYCNIKTEVCLFETEYWSSDNAESKYYYEPWEVRK